MCVCVCLAGQRGTADGLTAAIGAGDENIDGQLRQGSWYYYKRADKAASTWLSTVKKVAADGGAEHRFGVSVAMDAAGLTVAVGAYRAPNAEGKAEAGKVTMIQVTFVVSRLHMPCTRLKHDCR